MSSVSASTSTSSSINSSFSDEIVETWNPHSHSQRQRRRRTTLPELLQLRQTHGLVKQRRRGYGYKSNPNHVASTSYLSYRGAWNPTRMQNTILVVGPGTPASAVRTTQEEKAKSRRGDNNSNSNSDEEDNEESNSSSSSSSASASSASSASANYDESNDEEEEEKEEGEGMNGDEHDEEHSRMEEDDDDNDDDDEARESDDDDSGSAGFYEFMRNNYGDSEEGDSSSGEESIVQRRSKTTSTYNYRPSMRHGGCINTAAWLSSDCGWRLSTASIENGDISNIGVRAIETEEIPTQLVTSGDDRLLKVWDVSEAMGNTSPFAGGTATSTPFSSSSSSSSSAENNYYGYKERWQSIYDSRRRNDDEFIDGCGNDYRPPGTVRLLATVSTGHKGNVFHVTPLKGRPGMFATCGADGFLRLVDVERCSSNGEAANGSGSNSSSNSSTVVVHPMYDHNNDESGNPRLFDPENPLSYFLHRNSGMCFSHTMLDDSNVGLLCSEKGLLRFDLRLSPREQSTKSLLPKTALSSAGSVFRSMRACKACTVLPNNCGGGKENNNIGGSTYVFGTCCVILLVVLEWNES